MRDLDYAALMENVRELAARYPFLRFTYLTESLMGRGIPMLRFGEGEKKIYYIGTHHGAERITGSLLLRFARELCDAYAHDKAICGAQPSLLFAHRTLYILPVLNPDGAEIAAHGLPENPLWRERLLQMNDGSTDFSRWQANARGVDLNHNYAADFAAYKKAEPSLGIHGPGPTRFAGKAPESEPESGTLVNFLRFSPPTALLTLHTQGREIYCGGKETPPAIRATAERLARWTGYTYKPLDGAVACGGLTDYCIGELGIPAFTLECGKGENPLPPDDAPGMYLELREALFRFPLMY